MRTTARVGSGPIHTTEGVLSKPADLSVRVQIKDLDRDSGEGIALGYRQEMFTISDAKGEVVASMDTGAGWGTDAILLHAGDRSAVVAGRDVLVAWIATFNAELAAALRGISP